MILKFESLWKHTGPHTYIQNACSLSCEKSLKSKLLSLESIHFKSTGLITNRWLDDKEIHHKRASRWHLVEMLTEAWTVESRFSHARITSPVKPLRTTLADQCVRRMRVESLCPGQTLMSLTVTALWSYLLEKQPSNVFKNLLKISQKPA